jgi:indolepyruvate ferredoxin oxidoreductase, beta subunit
MLDQPAAQLPVDQRLEDLLARARRSYPAVAVDVIEEGMRRLTVYQHRWYAEWYLNRLDTVHALGSTELLRETARHLAVRMSFEDVIRVAQAGVRAKDGEPVETTEHFKAGIEEIAAILPPARAKRLLAWGERTGRLGKTYFSMHLRSTTVLGVLRRRLMAGLQSWRPNTYRFAEEQAEIDRWLEQIRSAGRTNVDLAREIAECARLIKGYGDTYKRGLANYRRITAEVIEPALAWRMTPRAAVDAVASARVAALADPEGETLSKTLAAIAAAAPVLRHAAE